MKNYDSNLVKSAIKKSKRPAMEVTWLAERLIVMNKIKQEFIGLNREHIGIESAAILDDALRNIISMCESEINLRGYVLQDVGFDKENFCPATYGEGDKMLIDGMKVYVDILNEFRELGLSAYERINELNEREEARCR